MTARSHFSNRLRTGAAVGLLVILPGSLAQAQQETIAPVRSDAPAIVRSYVAPDVPPVRLANSPRLRELVRAGTLYLTAQDAIALALENNIDLEVARYGPVTAGWRVTRSEAGGALPGVPSNASQAGSVAAGQGVTGSQAAAGVRIAGAGGNNAPTTNASISQIGPVTQTLDPSIQEASTFSHTSTPQPNIVQSITPVLISDTRAHSFSYQQGFLTGGAINVTYTGNYLRENSPTDVLNPSTAPRLQVAFQHNLLRGFGVAVNARTITVAKMNRETSDLTFQAQVIDVVTTVLNAYYGLASAHQDVRAKRAAFETAQTFFTNVKEQVKLGAVAPPDLDTAETQVVTSRQALADSETTVEQQEIRLKNLLSRDGTADPVLRSVRILPVDPIVMPQKDDLAPLDEMVRQALANRSDLAVEKANTAAATVSAIGTKNGVRPDLVVFGAESHAGLSGAERTVTSQGASETADPFFSGGIGNALGQIFRRNFPTERIGAFYGAQIHNWQAQADYSIDQLQLRQSQLTTRKDLNQVEVDVLNGVVSLQQARARYDAAARNRVLQEELLAAEQKRFALGTSTPYNVIQQQRDMVNAQSSEVAALAAYATARISLDRTLGATLTANHISLTEAREGRGARPSAIREPAPAKP